jgi:hypothetical protein
MAQLAGNPGFAPSKSEHLLTRRHAAIELVATLALTVSLVIAATAVSMGQKSMARAAFIERASTQIPLARDQAEFQPQPVRALGHLSEWLESPRMLGHSDACAIRAQ